MMKLLEETAGDFDGIARKLIKRKKRKYSSDPRTVGHHEVVMRDGGLILRAEAHLPEEKRVLH